MTPARLRRPPSALSGTARLDGAPPTPYGTQAGSPTWRWCAALAALLLAPLAARAQTSECAADTPAAFERCAERHALDLIEAHGFPSLSLGVVRGDRLVWAGSYGVADRETGAPATPRTLYQVGSVTKMFTGLLFALMVEDGTVRLSDRLADHLPDGVRVPTDADSSHVTLQHLATHTSGLPRVPPNLDRVDGDPMLGFTLGELYEGLAASELVFPVGTGREYSNLGFGLLAHALERAAGEPYEALLRRYVLGPLGMDATGLALDEGERARLATAYRDDDPTVATRPWDMGAISGAGGLFSSVEDLARLVAFQTSRSYGALGPDGAAAVRLAQTPFYRYPDQSAVAYGFGHFVYDWVDRDATLVLHNGDVDGYAGHVRFSPELGVGVVVLANSGMGQHVGPLAAVLMNAALDAYGGDRPAAEVTSHWDGAAWAATSRTVFSYDRAGGEPTLVLNQSREGGAWSDASKEEWALDAEGRQTTGRAYERVDGSWSERMTTSFFYDAEGNKTAARRRSLGDGGATNADSLASTFEGGRETERQFFRWQGGAWTEVLRQTSTYDAGGRETARVHLSPGADGWEEQRRWTFTYDGAGLLAGSVVEQMDGGAWTPWLNQTYTYDADGDQTGVVHEEWDGAGWTNMMKNETRYGSSF